MTTQVSINGNANSQFSEFVPQQNNTDKTAIIDNEKAEALELQKVEKKAIEQSSLAEQVINSKQGTDLKSKEGESSKLNDSEELDEAMESIAEFMQLSTQNVNFQRDDSTDKTIIKVFDTASKELIKQFPSEEVIQIAQKIAELRQDVGLKTGILLDEKV